MNKIPLAIATDKNLCFAVAVTFTSILLNAHEETFYELYCLCSDDVAQEDKNKILALQDKFPNSSITIIDMHDRFADAPSTHQYVTKASLYKMTLAELFPNYNKIIYLDSDIIVRKDLSELYNFAIQDNYIAGVLVISTYFRQKGLESLLDIPNLEQYVNGGVLLFNLQAIRQEKIEAKMQSYIGQFSDSVDQHIINKVCYGKIAFLPLKYNLSQDDLTFYENNDIQTISSISESHEAYTDPAIMHWTNDKPWKYSDLFLAWEWNKYFLQSSYKDLNLNRKLKFNLVGRKKCTKYYLLGFIPISKKVDTQTQRTKYILFNCIPILTIKNVNYYTN